MPAHSRLSIRGGIPKSERGRLARWQRLQDDQRRAAMQRTAQRKTKAR